MSVSVPVIDYIDTTLKRIFLKTGVVSYHPVDDIYKEVRFLRRVNEDLRKFKIMVTAEGNKPKGGGKFTARYAIFNNGYKVVPQDNDHSLYISGEQITDAGQSGPDCIDTSLLSIGTNVTIHYEPPASELVRADVEIEAVSIASFQGAVTIDTILGDSGIVFPIGAKWKPVNNIADALVIADKYGLDRIIFRGTLDIPAGVSLAGRVLVGANAINSSITIDSTVPTTNTIFEDTLVHSTTFTDDIYIKHCLVHNISGFSGYMEGTMISGLIGVSNRSINYLVDCKSGCVGLGSTDLPILDLTGENQHISFRNFSGPIKLTNSTHSGNTYCIDIISGATIILDSSCTAGLIYIRGVAEIINNSNMTVIKDASLSQLLIAEKTWTDNKAVTKESINNIANLVLATS